MANVEKCCVNLSGRSWPVYDGQNVKIGELEPREFCTYEGYEGSLSAIYFMRPSGAMDIGYLVAPENGVLTPIEKRPYGRATINGKSYITFYMRNTMNLYNMNGTVVGSVAAGKRVACLSSMSGDTMPYLKAINYAEKRAGGWDPMADGSGRYGFVDTGMRNSTSANGISLYGNW